MIPDETPQVREVFEDLINESKKIQIGYKYKINEWKEYTFIIFDITKVNEESSSYSFGNKIRKLIESGLKRTNEIIQHFLEEEDQISYLEEVKDELYDLKHITTEDELVYEESEFGPEEKHRFRSFVSFELNGNLEEDATSRHKKSIAEKAQNFALAWDEAIEEGKQRVDFLRNHLVYLPTKQIVTTQIEINEPFVSDNRVNELKSISSSDFDLTKLIKLCEEANIAYNVGLYHSVAMVVRAIIDHIPPIFGKTTFNEMAGGYGTRSFKDSMNNLNKSLRKIADAHIHSQIRSREVLPNKTQVNFSSDLDVLLSEICRILKQ